MPEALPVSKHLYRGMPVKGKVTDRPPYHLCRECAQVFKPGFNEKASDGTFYWGEEAIAQYNRSYPRELGVGVIEVRPGEIRCNV